MARGQECWLLLINLGGRLSTILDWKCNNIQLRIAKWSQEAKISRRTGSDQKEEVSHINLNVINQLQNVLKKHLCVIESLERDESKKKIQNWYIVSVAYQNFILINILNVWKTKVIFTNRLLHHLRNLFFNILNINWRLKSRLINWIT